MDRIVRIQTWAGVGTVVALPILYIGGVNELIVLEVIGFILFAISMLITPALRFLPALKEPRAADRETTETSPERGHERSPPSN